MTLADARAMLLETVKQDGINFTPLQLDTALRVALGDFARKTKCIRGSFTLPLAANVFMATMTAGAGTVPADWRRERTQSIQVAYNSRGAWNSGTTYSPFDLVQNTGTPDSFYYVCTTANTNIQPPNSGYWQMVTTDVFCPVKITSEPQVNKYAQQYIGNGPYGNDAGYQEGWGWPGCQWLVPVVGCPVVAAFRNDSMLRFWPQTKQAFNLLFCYWQMFTTWTYGTTDPTVLAATTLNIPDDYIDCAITSGCAAQLMLYENKQDKLQDRMFKRFDELISEVHGTVNVDTANMSRRAMGIWN